MGKTALIRWRRSVAAALICLSPLVLPTAFAQGLRSYLPVSELRFSEGGDLVGWQVRGLGSGTPELIEPGKALLQLRLMEGSEDASGGVAWRRTVPAPNGIAAFVGTHERLSLEIRRHYDHGFAPGTFVHQVEIVSARDGPAPVVRASVALLPELRRHAPRDGSLGDYLYGYGRLFFAPVPAGGFEPVREPVSVSEVALVVRHVAVIAAPRPIGAAGFEASPGSGATQALDLHPGANRLRLELGALKLSASGAYPALMYPELWGPLAALARLLEAALEAMAGLLDSAAAAVVVLALLLRVVLWPLNLWSLRQQRHFAAVQRRMKPAIERIQATMKGAQRSEEILGVYKEHGVTPLSGLKGSAGLLIQLPILIALFAVTTESALFLDAPFLWAPDLSLPDRALALPFRIPGLGSHLNALPLVLGAACVAGAAAQSRFAAPGTEVPLRSGLVLALAFVVLFYSCAAALVLYWTVVNLAQIAEAPLAAGRLPNET